MAVRYAQVTLSSTAVTLLSSSIPTGCGAVLVQPEGASCRYRPDNISPTTAIGMLIADGASKELSGDFGTYRFIAVSGAPKLNLLFRDESPLTTDEEYSSSSSSSGHSSSSSSSLSSMSPSSASSASSNSSSFSSSSSSSGHSSSSSSSSESSSILLSSNSSSSSSSVSSSSSSSSS